MIDFHSLEVVYRVSETQLQVSENSNQRIWQLNKGLKDDTKSVNKKAEKRS